MEDDRPILVFIHGTPGGIFSFAQIVYDGAGLVQNHEIGLIEMPGHGQSKGDIKWSFDSIAAAVANALDQVLKDRHCRGPVVLVGHSSGAEVALRVAEMRALDKLVLISASGFARDSKLESTPGERVLAGWRGTASALLSSCYFLRWIPPLFLTRADVREDLRFYGVTHFIGSERSLEELTEEYYHSAKRPLRNFRAMLQLGREEIGRTKGDDTKLRQRIKASSLPPVLLIYGSDDGAYSVDRQGRAYLDALGVENNRLVILEHIGHSAQEQAPALVNELIRAWVGGNFDDPRAWDKWSVQREEPAVLRFLSHPKNP